MAEPDDVGFDRPKIQPLHDTVKFYQRHLFICTGTTAWPAHIERDGGFVQALSEAIAERADAMSLVVKLNACDEPSLPLSTGEPRHLEPPAGLPAHDLLVFPDQVRYVGVTPDDFPVLVADHLVENRISPRLPHGPVTGTHLFVCVHAARDDRCGVCGPPLANLFAAELARQDLGDRVHVHRTSHVGGHQFAGNVLIYPGGDWYGYVTPGDVPRIIKEHVLRGRIVADLWRGRMGQS